MLITAEEYENMGFPEIAGVNLDSCIMRTEYIIGALTEGRAAKAVNSGGEPARLVKQAAGFQTYMLARETERLEKKNSSSSTEKVSLGDYSYSSQTNHSTEQESEDDCENAGLTVIHLLRSAGCLYAGVEVLE